MSNTAPSLESAVEAHSHEHYLRGESLIGDDYDAAQLQAWYADEKDGYAKLVRDNRGGKAGPGQYEYHALNWFHGYSRLAERGYPRVLGLGSAYGDELKPILKRCSEVVIVDPSEQFATRRELDGVPCRYLFPSISGDLPFVEGHFALITSFGVLHHIANVSHVLRECARCLEPGGFMLAREPIVSMGDWRFPRPGLTKRERGLPLQIFLKAVEQAGFIVRRRALLDVPAVHRIWSRLGIHPFAHAPTTILDAIIAAALSWRVRYHATSVLQKIRPCSVFLVLEKGPR